MLHTFSDPAIRLFTMRLFSVTINAFLLSRRGIHLQYGKIRLTQRLRTLRV